jgi:hypothetical protein
MFDRTNTRWVNPTNKPVTLDVCITAESVDAKKAKGPARRTIVIPPQGTELSPADMRSGMHHYDTASRRLIYTILPAELDGAIHQKQNGVVVGGLAPQLRVFDEDEPIVAAALQPEKLALSEALKVEKERQREADEAEKRRLAAQADARAAEEQNGASRAAAAEKDRADKAVAEAAAKDQELEALRAELAKSNRAKAEAEELLSKATAPAAPAAPAAAAGGSDGGGKKSGGK